MESHLLQMRGLKQRIFLQRYSDIFVASFTDAWIETARASRFVFLSPVASFTDAWIETTPTTLMYANWRRIFYRCVD